MDFASFEDRISRMGMPLTTGYFHVTEKKNVPGILQRGICPKRLLPNELRKKSTLDSHAVYFFNNLYRAWTELPTNGVIFWVWKFPADTQIIHDPEYASNYNAPVKVIAGCVRPDYVCYNAYSLIGAYESYNEKIQKLKYETEWIRV